VSYELAAARGRGRGMPRVGSVVFCGIIGLSGASPRVAGEAGACVGGSGVTGGTEGAWRWGAEGLGCVDPGPGYVGGGGEYPGGGLTPPLAALCAARLC